MIGIIDSGMGGLSTLAAIIRARRDHRFCYWADTANAPYGDKGQFAIMQAVRHAADALARRGADRIVLACNTATLAALGYLRRAGYAVWGVRPPVEEALACGGSTLLVGTVYTVRRYTGRAGLGMCALPRLATMVDEGAALQTIERYCMAHLGRYAGVDNLVLGCTHYALVRDVLAQITRAKRVFDGNDTLVDALPPSPVGRGIGVDVLSSGAMDSERYLTVLDRLLAD